jgi:hypothetical protein
LTAPPLRLIAAMVASSRLPLTAPVCSNTLPSATAFKAALWFEDSSMLRPAPLACARAASSPEAIIVARMLAISSGLNESIAPLAHQ